MAANNRRQGQGQKGRPTDNRLLRYFLSRSNYQLPEKKNSTHKKMRKINVVEPTICLGVCRFVRASRPARNRN